MSEQQRLALLAHCVALALDSVQLPRGREEAALDNAAQIARAVSLDMAAHWQPTVASYLGRVSKDRILEAVRESVSKEAADNLASMKKGAMAEASQTRMAGRGWLPAILRRQEPVPLAVAAE